MSVLGARGAGLAALAFALGLAVGGFGPRAEVRRLAEENEALRRRTPGVQDNLAQLLTGGLTAPRRPPPMKRVDDGSGADGAMEAAPTAPDAPGGARVRVEEPGEPTAPTATVGEISTDQLEAAREALSLRTAAARAALLEDAEPSAEQLDAIDAAIDQMNDRLVEVSYRLVDAAAEGAEPDRRAMMRVGADALQAMADAEDAILGSLTPEQRAAVRPEATDPTSFLDPSLIDVLSSLEQPAEAP